MPQMRLQSKQAGWYRTNCRRGRQVGGLWPAAVAERGTGRGWGRGRRQRRRGTAARQVGGRWAATAAVGNCCSPGGRAVGGGGGETGDGTGTGTGAWAAAAGGNCGSGHGLNCRRFCGTHDGRTEPVAGMWANWRENQQKKNPEGKPVAVKNIF